jgi:hypothetical protein
MFLEGLPLTPNGKVDRGQLPDPVARRPELDHAYVPPRDDLERLIARVWCEVLGVDRVGVNDRLFELGATSIQAARIVNRLQRELGEFIYVITIFDASSVAEYAAFLRREYAAAIASRGLAGGSAGAGPRVLAPAVVDATTIARLRECIPTLAASEPVPGSVGERNPPALFILAPPRSGTTLLRVMLAGHPRLFAAAELQLLGFHTLEERRRAYAGKYSGWLEGAIRAVMEIKQCAADEAKGVLDEYERGGLTTKAFYRLLQDWVAPKMLADKSPSYALDPAGLAKAERDFENPLYVHLVRHPYAMVRSFEHYHVDQVLYLRDHPFGARQLGEMVWAISHQNALDFLAGVPGERRYCMRFEDLVSRPREIMEVMCRALGLEFHADLVQPYKGIDRKMVDGIYADSTPMGDTKLLERQRIDPAVAESWRGVMTDDFLSDVTWTLAAVFGYPRFTQRLVSRGERLRRLREWRAAPRFEPLGGPRE